MAKVHPYKGYLNTEFRFYANGTEDIAYDILSESSDSDTPVLSGRFTTNIPHSIKLKAPGEYKVVFNDGTSSNIIVEDGYKFGGSAYKTSFIFDENPWCFIIMNDRTYFYNRVTEVAYVETISPDVINVISPDYVLFINNGHDERTVYSLAEQKPILNVTNIVYYNKEIIIWQECIDDTIIKLKIYSLEERAILKTLLVDKFVIDNDDNSIIYKVENNLYKQGLSLPLNEFHTFNINGQLISLVAPNIAISVDKLYNSSNICIFNTHEGKVISRLNVENAIASINSDTLIDINEHIDTIKLFDITQIGCEKALIKATFDSFTFYPTKWDILCVIKERVYEHGTRRSNNTITYKIKSLSSDVEFPLENDINKVVIRDNVACFANYQESIIFGLNISPEYSKNVTTYIHNKDVIRSLDTNLSLLDETEGWKPIKLAKYSLRYFDEFGIIKDEENNTNISLHNDTIDGYASVSYRPFRHLVIGSTIVLQSGEILPNFKSSISKSKRFGLTLQADGIFLLTQNGLEITREKILSDLYDTSSYKSVLLSEDGSQIMYRDEKQTVILDVTSNDFERFDNISYIKDINGIRPLFLRRPGSLQPRIVNPVTGQILPHNRMAAYQFVSPNGLLYADTEIDKYVETWDLIANRILSDSEIAEYADNLSYIVGSEKETSKIKEENRRQFIENNLQFFKVATQNWAKRSDKQLILSLLRLPYADFAKLFLERRGVAYIKKKSNDSVVAKIQLGDPLWFLNYVSFSYDNRFVAIAGRYPNRSNYGGLFLVYDLINKKEIIAKRNSWAVWMTAFNQQNHVAAYSSEPISYDSILSDTENGSKIESYPNFSFLTFSPRGEYAALSNQGYVSKYDKHGNERLEWGHMPSCEVYVVHSCDFGNVLIKFSDLSKSGIDGLADKDHNCAKTVTSVSFSNDNKRLMMVGNDGVIVIRNLHLNNDAE